MMHACMQEVKSLVNQNLPSICSLFLHVPSDAPGTFQNDLVFRDSAMLLAARLQVLAPRLCCFMFSTSLCCAALCA